MKNSTHSHCIACQDELTDGRTRYCASCSPVPPFNAQAWSREQFSSLKAMAKSNLRDLKFCQGKADMRDYAGFAYDRYCGLLREMVIEARCFHFRSDTSQREKAKD